MVSPRLYILVGISGAGKSTILPEVLKSDSTILAPVSCTTRAMRKGDVDGVNYYYITREEFERRVDNGEFLEWAPVHGNLYGVLKTEITNRRAGGHDLLFDIDYQGACELQKQYGDLVEIIFVLPPSLEEWIRRMKDGNRSTMSDEEVRKRFETAEKELAFGMQVLPHVVNSNLDQAVRDVKEIIRRRRVRGMEADLSDFDHSWLVEELQEGLVSKLRFGLEPQLTS
jgi:guanylate kinase